jgi:hypothetical protein
MEKLCDKKIAYYQPTISFDLKEFNAERIWVCEIIGLGWKAIK